MRKSNRMRFAVPAPPAEKVQSGLAVTPAQMLELTKAGIPISAQTVGATYDDGMRTLDFQPPMEHMRGIDVADLWEHQQHVKKAVSAGHDKAFNVQPKTD